MLRVLTLLGNAICLTVPALADVTWMTKPFAATCKEVSSGNVDAGEDYVFSRCDGVGDVATWTLYNEGTRLSVGFGPKPHTALRNVDAERENWPVDWAIEKDGSISAPRAAIARFNSPGAEPYSETLYVFRILDDGMSCVIGTAITNEEARLMAMRSLKTWTCQSEAEPFKIE
jgi:hypothetical protein